MLGSPQILMMSGAWPPPAPSVWIGVDGAALDGGDGVFDEAGFVERVGVDGHLHVVLVGDRRQQSIAAGVVPQSSCSLRPQAPASTCSCSASGMRGVALAGKAEVHRQAFGRLQHACRCTRGRACRWWRWCRSRGRCRRRSWW